ncbi:MAG: hypothetical protein COA79_11905 [Planctomycetota bacterium]|nr:MAG: hypothetical protein COA79_11905 [Planctomycetota bacterium]
MSSLKDIAAITGTSVRTVSRALNDNGYVKAALKIEILKVAKDLDYRINLMAQSLRTKKSFLIELVCPIGADYARNMPKVEAFEEKMREEGYRVSLFLLRDIENSLSKDMDVILCQNPSGIALFHFSKIDLMVKKLNDCNLPYITLGHTEKKIDKVGMDRKKGIQSALKHFQDKGRKRIAYLGNEKPKHYYGKVRLNAYLSYMKKAKLKPLILNIPTTKDNFNIARTIGKKVSLKTLPDGVLAYSDSAALGFMQGLQSRGVKFPEDISIIGFNASQAGEVSNPPLSTIAHPNEAIGTISAEILLAKIKGQKEPKAGWSRELPPVLLLREST